VTSRTVTLLMRPPSWPERWWYRRLRRAAPLATCAPRDGEHWARLVPYRLRWFHRRYATRHGYFWHPCILCDRPYGGHEAGESIPDPTDEDGRMFILICSRCTRSGRSTL
jgi:hypothetical protein